MSTIYVGWDDGTYLYHHGIKGMKWGERRFQNEDGSLTEEGRKRYGVGEASGGGLYSRVRNAGMSRREAKIDKKYNKKLERLKEFKKTDHDSWEPYKESGISTKNGKMLITAKEVKQYQKEQDKAYDKMIAKLEMKYKHQKQALNIEKNMSNGEHFTKRLLGNDGFTAGSKSYAALVESGMSKRGATVATWMLGATGGTILANARNAKADRQALKKKFG